jgi:hypothetical protein
MSEFVTFSALSCEEGSDRSKAGEKVSYCAVLLAVQEPALNFSLLDYVM